MLCKIPVQNYSWLGYVSQLAYMRIMTYLQPIATSNFGFKIQQHAVKCIASRHFYEPSAYLIRDLMVFWFSSRSLESPKNVPLARFPDGDSSRGVRAPLRPAGTKKQARFRTCLTFMVEMGGLDQPLRFVFLIAFIFRKSRDKSFGFHGSCFAF